MKKTHIWMILALGTAVLTPVTADDEPTDATTESASDPAAAEGPGEMAKDVIKEVDAEVETLLAEAFEGVNSKSAAKSESAGDSPHLESEKTDSTDSSAIDEPSSELAQDSFVSEGESETSEPALDIPNNSFVSEGDAEASEPFDINPADADNAS